MFIVLFVYVTRMRKADMDGKCKKKYGGEENRIIFNFFLKAGIQHVLI